MTEGVLDETVDGHEDHHAAGDNAELCGGDKQDNHAWRAGLPSRTLES